MALNLILLVIMVVTAIWTVMVRSLLKAAIGLAVVSVIITIFMFGFDSPLAAVFELSVCAGLITVIFLSTIGLTKPLANKEIDLESKERVKRKGASTSIRFGSLLNTKDSPNGGRVHLY